MVLPELSLTEWIVLSLIAERSCHGFAVVSLTATDAEIGRYWHVSQPMVYRSIARLTDRGLVDPVGLEESERGPQRTVVAATPAAKEAVTQWLDSPVDHLRDARGDLMVKLVLLRRRRASTTNLVTRQRTVFERIETGLCELLDAEDDFVRALSAWRLEHARSTLRLLDAMAAIGETPAEASG